MLKFLEWTKLQNSYQRILHPSFSLLFLFLSFCSFFRAGCQIKMHFDLFLLAALMKPLTEFFLPCLHSISHLNENWSEMTDMNCFFSFCSRLIYFCFMSNHFSFSWFPRKTMKCNSLFCSLFCSSFVTFFSFFFLTFVITFSSFYFHWLKNAKLP